MNFNINKLLLLLNILLLLGQVMNAADNEVIKKDLKPPEVNNSKRVYRSIILKNKLQVILVSDPKINQSAASMDVHVGSMQDPTEHQGQFHFLEHMLFLGTKKYPVVGEYSDFLKSHNGYSNAYTAEENTNYHFEVSHDAIDGALDRFAQFFISPLFNESETEKEVNNVNSEHQKNIPNDLWRFNQVIRHNLKKGHPANHFGTGNINTLKNCKREALIQAYEKFYSANEMTLCILSNKSLDELEDLCIKYFSDIPNRNIKAPIYPEEYIEKTKSLKLIQVLPKSDIKKLEIQFALPKFEKYKNTRASRLISSLLGHEGKGTITALLKRKGYVTSLSSGDDFGRSYGDITLSINLTPLGRENYQEILQTVFAYIKMLQNSPFPDYYYNELKEMALINYQNREESEGTKYTVQVSSNISEFGVDNALTDAYLFPELNALTKEAFTKILAELTPSNVIVSIASIDVITDKEEPYYKSNYSFTEDTKIYENLTNLKLNAELHLPEPNQFIPKNTKILAQRPYLLMFNQSAEIYYAQDSTFKLPKAAIVLQYLTPIVKENARNEILAALYCDCFNEILNEEVYPMVICGLTYHLKPNSKGLVLEFDGYSDQILPLVKYVSSRLKTVNIKEDLFKTFKEKMTRNLKNVVYDQAYRQTLFLYHEFVFQQYYNVNEKLTVLETIKYEDLVNFGQKSLFKTGFIQGSVYGNILPNDVRNSLEDVIQLLNYKPLERKNFPERNVAQITEDGTRITLAKKLLINNSALIQSFNFGIENPKKRGAALVLASILDSPYYKKMRTDEHLGYIVWSFMDQQEKNIYQTFMIQSGEFSADYLKERSNLFIQNFRTELESIKPEDIETHKKAVIDKKLEKPKTINATNDKFFYQAFEKKGNFDHVESDIDAVNTITKSDIIALYDEIANNNKKKVVTILCYGSQHEQAIPETTKEELKNLKSKFKYERPE